MKKPFDPSGVGVKNGHFFGVDRALEDAKIWILGLPWDLTTSYRAGTRNGPEHVLEASYQVDLYRPDAPESWKIPFATLPLSNTWAKRAETTRKMVEPYLAFLEEGGDLDTSPEMQARLKELNQESLKFHEYTYKECQKAAEAGCKVLTIGGDHSVSVGPLRALHDDYVEKKKTFSILHIDAHADLRNQYEGFEDSHASIINRALELSSIQKIVQIGIRDLSEQEALKIKMDPRLKTFFDWDIQAAKMQGTLWAAQTKEIINELSDEVYISFDIDGLDPKYCPDTGTPVPGGFALEEIFFLFRELKKTGRRVIGADLVEVAPGKTSLWNGNVGARILLQLLITMHELPHKP